MSKYTIINNPNGYSIFNNEAGLFFNGYDFMGSVNWEDEEMTMEISEAQQIVKDLESADEPEEDPVIKSLQATLDYAQNRRNDEFEAYDKLRVMDHPHAGMLDNQYRLYREAQAFYEGVTMAIFAAGYSISTQIGSDHSTVTK